MDVLGGKEGIALNLFLTLASDWWEASIFCSHYVYSISIPSNDSILVSLTLILLTL
jgi:hypothetical protein